ncbi:hypothetical protein CEXT_255351 [Caerostris extrusa]|uniref:Uncharacterized protein n=1 Tax=Caerostris extrusa TaxID=172846 RepID=A0AAV4R9T5_CAEEX|nr:hypothetical protein CEXT_255351 [Caerostris extrusa]
MALIFPLYQPGHSETRIDLTLEQCWVNLFTPSPRSRTYRMVKRNRGRKLCEDSRDTSTLKGKGPPVSRILNNWIGKWNLPLYLTILEDDYSELRAFSCPRTPGIRDWRENCVSGCNK